MLWHLKQRTKNKEYKMFGLNKKKKEKPTITEKMVVEKKRIENMFKIRLSKYNFIDTILYLASKGDEGKDTGIDSGRLKKFLECEVPSLVAETIQIEITMDVMNELKRVSALAEAVYGKRPSINEVLYNSLKVYKRTLLQEIS